MRHTLTNLNENKREAVCAICGPTSIISSGKLSDGRVRFRCSKFRSGGSSTRHCLSNIDSDSRMAICSVCGPVKVCIHRSEGRIRYRCSKLWNEHSRASYFKNPARHLSLCRSWDKRNPEKRSIINRKSHVKLYYGITLETYENILISQSGVCALCGKEPSKSEVSLSVDHDHKCCASVKTCGKCHRGLLCSVCNKQLGVVESLLSRGLITSLAGPLAEYIDKWSVIHSLQSKAATAI